MSQKPPTFASAVPSTLVPGRGQESTGPGARIPVQGTGAGRQAASMNPRNSTFNHGGVPKGFIQVGTGWRPAPARRVTGPSGRLPRTARPLAPAGAWPVLEVRLRPVSGRRERAQGLPGGGWPPAEPTARPVAARVASSPVSRGFQGYNRFIFSQLCL